MIKQLFKIGCYEINANNRDDAIQILRNHLNKKYIQMVNR